MPVVYKYILLLSIWLYHSNNAIGQDGILIVDSVYSPILSEYSKYAVYLPKNFKNNLNKNYPVIYLLHGFNGNHLSWINSGKAVKIIDSLVKQDAVSEAVFVMPDGKNSYFINSYDFTFRFEDFFLNEFIPYIEGLYSIPLRPKRAIIGLSMGGYGALVLSLKNPGMFNTCIALSAANRPPEVFSQLSQLRYKLLFGDVFCDTLIGEERITDHWKNNSPFFLIDSNYNNQIPPLNIYLDCGMQDYLFLPNQVFHNLLIKNNIPHEYHMRVGKHNWEYWRQGLMNSLLYLELQFNDTGKSNN